MIYYSFNILGFVISITFLKKYLHIYQLKDYSNRYFSFFKTRLWFFFLCLLAFIFQLFLKSKIFIITSNFVLLSIFLCVNLTLIKSIKTPLVWTKKIKRLFLISSVILALITLFKFSCSLFPIVILILPIVSNFLNIYDKIKNKKFILSAQTKLKQSKCKIIAITGSNGKTSVKNILLKMLSTTYNVQATPSSFNTPLGISSFINNSLKQNCDYLILEYGARKRKDIKKLCNTFGADIGIVTGVFAQHLETFKTLENVYKTKKELPDFLKEKLCIYNIDNDETHLMFHKKTGEKIGVSIKRETDITADDLEIENFKTKFKMTIFKKTYNISTNLLGEHNVINILMCVALAKKLKIKDENIIEAIKDLQPTPHRLQYIKSATNVLDDSYNCSITSAKKSLKVLKLCPGKKMVVTPGIIEGGKEQFSLNHKLGTMLSFANYVIIVGKTNKKAIVSGLHETISRCQIICVETLEKAKEHFNKLSNEDTLLLLNDLPDDYT